LVEVPPGAIQLSPLVPGSTILEDVLDGAFSAITAGLPQAAQDRRYVMAQSLRLLAEGGRLTALAAKDRGGLRLAKELGAFGCAVDEVARRHFRICVATRPAAPLAIAETIAACGPQQVPALGAWSQPGLFSWDRMDPGTALLLRYLPVLAGRGADFGCGVGTLAAAVLRSEAVTHMALIDLDRRAVESSRRNVRDPRAAFVWRDLRGVEPAGRDLDFVVMNPPFHDGGTEDRSLGAVFIRQAAAALRPGGVCWLVANRHLPYEAALAAHFATSRLVAQEGGYKVYEARA
jgi:16S rRNA (guanine1207-N2)-methyltransferase